MRIEEVLKNPGRISIDTRTMKKGGVFLAIKGARFDGHDFIGEAFKKGARAAIVRKVPKRAFKGGGSFIKVKDTIRAMGDIAKLHRLKFNIPVICVTGSNGKTTAKDMIAHILSSRYNVLKNGTSKNNLIGLPLTLFGLNKKHDVAVLEMGMNRLGEIDRLSDIANPTIGVIANIGPSHLKFLGKLRNVFIAKKELLKHLQKGNTAILNVDDLYLRNIKKLKAKKVHFGIEGSCKFRARDLRYSKNTWSFSLGSRERFRLPLPGRHNIYNALIAIAVARQFGINFSTIAKRLKSFKASCPMRLEFKNVRGVKILDDSYNSNPLSMECAVDTLSRYDAEGGKIIVSGDMLELGEKARTMHEGIGKMIARSHIDALITMGKLSRFMRKKAKEEGMEGLYQADSHHEAARLLRKIAKPGDVILVKGSRAMNMEKVIEEFK